MSDISHEKSPAHGDAGAVGRVIGEELGDLLRPQEVLLRPLLARGNPAFAEVADPLLLAWETATKNGTRPERSHAFWEWFRSLPGSRAFHAGKGQNLLDIEEVLIRKHGLARARVARLGYCKARDLAGVLGATCRPQSEEARKWIEDAEKATSVAEFQRMVREDRPFSVGDRRVFRRYYLTEASAVFLDATIALAKTQQVGGAKSDAEALDYICHEFCATYGGFNNHGEKRAFLKDLLRRIAETHGVEIAAFEERPNGEVVRVFGLEG